MDKHRHFVWLALCCLGVCLGAFVLFQLPEGLLGPGRGIMPFAETAVQALACAYLGVRLGRRAALPVPKADAADRALYSRYINLRYGTGCLALCAAFAVYSCNPEISWSFANLFPALTADPAVRAPAALSYWSARAAANFLTVSSVFSYFCCGLGYLLTRWRRGRGLAFGSVPRG